MITRQQGGQVKSQSDFDGASITFDNYLTEGVGLQSTQFGQFVYNSQYRSCFEFMDNQAGRFLVSVGR